MAGTWEEVQMHMRANDEIYEWLLAEVAAKLNQPQQQKVQDALHQTCVVLGRTPMETLHALHTFLVYHHQYVENDQPKGISDAATS